jgi:hypothetical protein
MSTNINTQPARSIIKAVAAEAAKASTAKAIASLHPDIRPVIEPYVNKLLTSLNALHRLKESEKRFSDPSFVPRSLRTKFNCTSIAAVEHKDDFKALKQQSIEAFNTYLERMKELMLESKQLEIQQIYLTIVTNIYKASAF